jgi:hypothetical protein
MFAADYLVCSTLSVDSTRDYPIPRLPILQPTIPSSLSSDTAAVLCSTMSVDSTSNYPIYRLSTLRSLAIPQPTIRAEILKDSRTLYKRERYKTRLKGLTIIK